VKFQTAINLFITDWTSQGRMNSPRTELAYRATLELHGKDVANRDPSKTGRDDVKRTLLRWGNPNTQYTRRAHLVAFYDWCMEEGHRETNPARQTRRPRRKKAQVYRLTRGEAAAMLQAAQPGRETRCVFIGMCAGLRLSELLGLQGRHFQRPGFIWVSRDIGKGHKERWVPIINDLEPIVAEIRGHVALDEYVLPAERWRNPGINTLKTALTQRPASRQVIRTICIDVASRAGIAAHVHPHLLRHAFGDHIARYAGLKAAQYLMGHESVDTTEGTYTGEPTLDELVAAVRGFAFLPGLSLSEQPEIPAEARTGIEPVDADLQAFTQHFDFDSAEIARKVALYRDHFAALEVA